MAQRVALLPLADEAKAGRTMGDVASIARILPGVHDATVDPIGRIVRVVYDGDIDIRTIAHILAQQGYPIGAQVVTEGAL